MNQNLFTAFKIFALVFVVGLMGTIVYDILFSKPIVMEGIVIDKVYMPQSTKSGQNILPYMKYKSYDYIVTAQQEEQWIAFVKTKDGKLLKVNCHMHHYKQTQVGDKLRFKVYSGKIFHIDYFSHNEDELEKVL